MSGRKNISAYTPSNTDPKVLKRIFVQREKLLGRIVDRMSRSMTSGDKHHILLVGPRGSGKTNLVSLATWDLQGREELKDIMRVAWLGEDDSFTGLVHLAFGIAGQLAQEYPNEFPSDFKSRVRGLSQDDAALAVLQSTIKLLGKRSLLLVTENMDQTFQSLGDSGQKKWRAFLQETRKIATLATAQQLFGGVSDRNEAFFGFFDIHHLKPLSVEQAAELMARISTELSKPELVSYLNSAEGRFRVRALHYLAGGNHRMYVLLAEFLTKSSLDDLVAAFENLANDMTPYFQERIRSLPDQQRQLVQCLCDAEGALTVKEVAGETFIDERICAKQLGNLKAKGYVQSEKRGKESYYDMAEPLMRLCLEVKNQRGRPLKLVARFLRAWFPLTALQLELTKTQAGRVGEYCEVAMESSEAYSAAIGGKILLEIGDSIKCEDLVAAKKLTQELHFADESLARKVALMLAGVEMQKGYFNSSATELNAIIETSDSSTERSFAQLLRAVSYSHQGDLQSAQADCSAVIQMADAAPDARVWALFQRGRVYGQQGDAERELADYSALIELADAPVNLKARALVARSFSYGKQGDIDRAMADYSVVIAMADAPVELKAEALFNRGVTYGKQGDVDRELADYSAVIQMTEAPVEPKLRALINRGITFGRHGDVKRELMDYTAVVEMANAPIEEKAKALVNRGITYSEQVDVERALADYSAVIEMADAPVDQKCRALFNRGLLNFRAERFEESASDYEAVLAIPYISSQQRTEALFAVVKPMTAYCSLDEIRKALKRAFEEGDSQTSEYGGTPRDLFSMVLRRSPAEWPNYVSAIVPLYIEHGVAEKLGQGVTQSIQLLDEGDFSKSQIDTWNAAWQEAGAGCDDLEIPLRCLKAAVEVMKSDPPTDRPLFQLPLEIRGLVRPLLNRSLGES